MKFKALVLIGSLIAFSSCEKEDSEDVNVNELSLDSRLIGNWIEVPTFQYDRSFSSDGTYGAPFGTGKYSVVRNTTGVNSAAEGKILYIDGQRSDSYYFLGDTLFLYGAGLDGTYVKE